MWLSTDSVVLRRQAAGSRSSRNNVIFTVVISLLTVAVLIFLLYLSIRRLRYHYANPRYVPTEFLKRKWRSWRPAGTDGGLYSRTSLSQTESNEVGSGRDGRETESAVGLGVGRHASLRSIATLPAYKPTAGDSEQILGREGERAGIDVVVDFPETAEEEESRRDDHMETLYQIRQARRTENAEREDRRRRRQEARDRGDTAALDAIRLESRVAREQRARAESAASNSSLLPSTAAAAAAAGGMSAGSSTSLPLSVLTIEHATRLERERRISSVSYADVGLARHDGTRVRASSDSERPLLDGAVPMGAGGAGSRSSSPFNPARVRPPQPPYHRRNSSMNSLSTNASATGPGDPILRPSHSRNMSLTTTMTMSDVGSNEANRPVSPLPASLYSIAAVAIASDGDMPPAPPGYDDLVRDGYSETAHDEAPPYEIAITSDPLGSGSSPAPRTQRSSSNSAGPGAAGSPLEPAVERAPTVRTRSGAPQIPALRALPSIEITEGTPVNSQPSSPIRR